MLTAQSEFISALEVLVEQNIEKAQALKKYSLKDLQKKKDPKSWSALECIEHLMAYAAFYTPAIDQAISGAETLHQENELKFKSGFLGAYFSKSMKVKENQRLNKMKTFKSKNPIHSDKTLSVELIDQFIEYQIKMAELLKKASLINLNKVKTKTTLGGILKFKLGDTFNFVLNHDERHLIQAIKAVSN